jgi:hypothetical protein
MQEISRCRMIVRRANVYLRDLSRGRIGAGIFPCLLAIVVFSVFELTAASPAVAAEKTDGKAKVVEVTVGSNHYAIPSSYILAVRRDKEDGPVTRVMMRALLPDLDPNGMELIKDVAEKMTVEEFIERHIFISLESNPRQSSRFLEGSIRDRRQREETSIGLTKYTLGPLRTFVTTEPAHSTPLGKPFVIGCPKLPKGAKKNFKHATPVCSTSYPFAEKAEGVYYRYYIVNLPKWREIDLAVRALLKSFQR